MSSEPERTGRPADRQGAIDRFVTEVSPTGLGLLPVYLAMLVAAFMAIAIGLAWEEVPGWVHPVLALGAILPFIYRYVAALRRLKRYAPRHRADDAT